MGKWVIVYFLNFVTFLFAVLCIWKTQSMDKRVEVVMQQNHDIQLRYFWFEGRAKELEQEIKKLTEKSGNLSR